MALFLSHEQIIMDDLYGLLKNQHRLNAFIQSNNVDTLFEVTGELIGRAKKGVTLLTLASHDNNESAVDTLIKAGANVNFMTDNGLTPLILATRKGLKQIAENLITNGAEIDLTDDWSPLLHACLRPNYDMVKFLIDRGADVDFSTVDGITPLIIAAQSDYVESAKLLCKAGCQLETKDLENGYTALTHAITHESRKVIEFLLIDMNAHFPHTINGQSIFDITKRSTGDEKIAFNSFLKSLLENHTLNQQIDGYIQKIDSQIIF